MPLFVDLDGTLIRTDLLFESLLLLIRRNPLYLAIIPFWLLKGRAWLKHQIACRVEIDPAGLPYNEAFLAWLGDQRARGRAMTLISASNQRYVSAVAEHVGLFDAAIGSDGKTNLKARNKLRRIEEIVQGGKFAYAGDSRADLPKWAGAGQILLVNCSPSIRGRFENSPAEVLRFGSAPTLFAAARHAAPSMAQEHLAVRAADPVASIGPAGIAVRFRDRLREFLPVRVERLSAQRHARPGQRSHAPDQVQAAVRFGRTGARSGIRRRARAADRRVSGLAVAACGFSSRAADLLAANLSLQSCAETGFPARCRHAGGALRLAGHGGSRGYRSRGHKLPDRLFALFFPRTGHG